MKLQFALAFTCAAIALSGCNKNNTDPVSKAINHGQDEIDKDKVAGETAGQWTGPCDTTTFVVAAAGVKSSLTVYDFYNKAGRTTKLFADEQCKNQVAQSTYSGTAVIGTSTSFDSSAHILDLNFTNVSIMISDQSLLNFMNNPVTPGCGINDWKLNDARDVTANVNSATGTCPYVAKTGEVFDVLKTDGRSLHFGAIDLGHDKSTQDKRPIALDNSVTYTK